MNLLYITFGNHLSNHLQCTFSIYSFLSASKKPQSINVVTDAPEFYGHLKQVINVITVPKEEWATWKGPHDFFWRVKIEALRQIANKYSGSPIVYLDTDTFLYGDQDLLMTDLQNGKALMHENEGALSEKKSKTERKMWGQVRQKNYGGVVIEAKHCMWNAGVVATPNLKNASEFELALRITDDMCAAGVTPRLIEQYALSVALSETYGLHAAAPVIAHYWSNKSAWERKISSWLLEGNFKCFTVNDFCREFKKVNLFDTSVVQYNRNTAERLKRLVGKFFPPRNMLFLKRD
jgi:hypothetical protein